MSGKRNVFFPVSTLTPTAVDLFGPHSAPSTHEMYPHLTCLTSLLCYFVDESVDTVTSYVRFCYDMISCPVEKLFNYPHKISNPFLKRWRRKKEHYSRLNDFTNVKLISSSFHAEKARLNSTFASRFSNCKYTPNINSVALNKCFIYGPTDTPVHLSPPLLNPPSSWRNIHKTSLPKKQQSAHAPHMFRPISTTPTELKISERLILGQIQPFFGEIQRRKPICIRKDQKNLGCSRPPRTYYCEVARWQFTIRFYGFYQCFWYYL